MKKIACILLGCAMVFGLVACTPPKNVDKNTDDTERVEETEKETEEEVDEEILMMMVMTKRTLQDTMYSLMIQTFTRIPRILTMVRTVPMQSIS